ncbi:hypothetical protein BDV59DRAFT_182480 [Aspergillus ambiguus]|uniref:uncharacterized protein n=1 Tax=Aspergillus ambiguus TaxID=176160 RepID=UPI003CCDABE4
MPFSITIGSSHHDSDSSYTDDEDSSAVEVSPPSTGSREYQDPYDEWAGLPYPDELKPSDSASRPRTSHRTRSRNQIHGSSTGRRQSMRPHHVTPDRDHFPRRRRAPSPESPESIDSAEDYGHPYRIPPERRFWPPAGGQAPVYPNSASPGPSYVYPNGPVPHGSFGPHNGVHPPSDQLIRSGGHSQFPQPTPYGHPAYPYGPLQQPPGHAPPYFPHDPHQIHTAHHTPTSSHSRSDGHNQQHMFAHPLHPHSPPPPFNGAMAPHDMVPYGSAGFYNNMREPYNMVPGAMAPYLNPPYQRPPSPTQIELAGALTTTGPTDTAKDEALARLEKLILEEKLEREARDKREADREAAAVAAAAAAAHDKKITEEAAASARAEAEKKAAEEAAKAKEEAEKAAEEIAAKAAEEAAKAAEEAAKAKEEAVAAVRAEYKVPEKAKPIKFKDAVGRKFSFPFDLCRTWNGMEELIKQAFLHVEGLGPHVADGHYDLIGPNGDIILPQVWETVIEPDWTITMHMWPLPEKPKDPEPAPEPAPAPDASGGGGKKVAGPKKPKPKPGDPGAFAMWMVGSSQRARLNKALKMGKKPRVVQHGSSCRVM